ncbi:hypothetical protein Golob_004335 [Gossypium lobatum]|uniref:Uncharacterized protein n=1 Tax=Gossypium lobatum TaxID=34289 RepID=A0A7J8N1A9_9ROSI|nr:hypothetical protein [Gossypium lobatum]
MASKATSLSYVTKEEVQRIHEEKNKSLSFSMFDLKLPYLAKFMETLRVARLDNDFKLKEFSKPLIEKAYTWHVILTLGYVESLHLENIALPTFATLVEATRRTNNTVQRQRGTNHFARRDTPTVNVIQGEGIEKRKKR